MVKLSNAKKYQEIVYNYTPTVSSQKQLITPCQETCQEIIDCQNYQMSRNVKELFVILFPLSVHKKILSKEMSRNYKIIKC